MLLIFLLLEQGWQNYRAFLKIHFEVLYPFILPENISCTSLQQLGVHTPILGVHFVFPGRNYIILRTNLRGWLLSEASFYYRRIWFYLRIWFHYFLLRISKLIGVAGFMVIVIVVVAIVVSKLIMYWIQLFNLGDCWRNVADLKVTYNCFNCHL